MSRPRRPLDSATGDAEFAATRWSLVVAAGRRSQPDSRKALEGLCQAYWYPLYAYVRRRVPGVHEAQDLTQEFFARLLEKNAFQMADRQRGRFRAFLLAALKNFLVNEWEKAGALKRGGGRRRIPLDFAAGETRFARELADESTPERIFEKQWALALLENGLARLRAELAAKGRQEQFEALKPFLSGESSSRDYAAVARQLGISEGAAKVSASRLRRRFRELLREEIADTVARPDDVEDEIRVLWGCSADEHRLGEILAIRL